MALLERIVHIAKQIFLWHLVAKKEEFVHPLALPSFISTMAYRAS